MELDSKKILLVEDEAMIALLEKRWLSKEGFNVIHASSGEKAIETVRELNGDIDLILMDIDLGSGIDGTEAAREILKDHDIPLLFLSSHTEPDIVKKTEEITSYGYVVKGSSNTVLLASIKMAFRLFKADKSIKEHARIIEEKAEIIEAEKQKAEQYLDVVEVMLLALDLNGRITLINRKGCQVLGYTEEELIGRRWSEVCLVPEESEMLMDYFNQMITEGLKSFEYNENYVLTKTGQKRLIAFHNSVLRDKNGNVTGTLSSGEDITERRQAKAKLLESEMNFRQLIENMGEGIGFVDQNETFVFSNPAGEEIFGVEPGRLAGRNLSEFHSPDDFKKVRDETALRKKGIKSVFESEIITPDGQKKTILVTSTPRISLKGDFLGSFGIFRDITERKEIVQRLKSSEQRLNSMASNVPGIVYQYCVNEDGTSCFTYLSEKSIDLLGLSLYKNDPIETVLANIPENDRERFLNSVNQAVSTASIWEYEGLFNCLNGQKKWLQAKGLPLRHENKLLYNGIMIDVTERKEAELLLQKYSEELKFSNAEKVKFLSVLAHDLKGPFFGFMDLTRQMAADPGRLTKGEIKEISEVMHSTSKGIFELLTNLLEWSRLQTGKIELKPEPLDLFYDVSGILNLFSSSITGKSITLQNNIQQGSIITADHYSISTILRNLISNAIKFTPSNGEILISSSQENGSTEISVSDTGVGMTQEILQKVFRIDCGFTTLGTNGEKGSGLGLVLCKEIANKNGWDIYIKSSPGEGTEFTLSLPVPAH